MTATYQFPNRVTAPPGGWRYVTPESGQVFTGVNEAQLLDHLRSHYRANNWDLPSNIRDLIEQQICEKQRDYCVDTGGRPPVSPSKAAAVAFHLIKDYTLRLLNAPGRVQQEQADARAAVCATCTENVEREGCSNCNMGVLRDLVVKIKGNRVTKSEEQLKVCRVCLCENRAKVWLTLEDLKKLTNKQEWEALPTTCWMRTEEAKV